MMIGSLEILGPAVLAPMAGVADRAFRELCISYGAPYVVAEMASAKGISMSDKKSVELLTLSVRERPAAVQIFGDNPKIMAQAAVKAYAFTPDVIDINMGCPAPKIANGGGGCALLKNPVLAQEIAKAVVGSVDIPVTVKIRSGWDSDNITAVEIAKRMEDAGVRAITVHGRTKVQMYAPPVDSDIIAQVKKAVSIPIIGNGDIADGKTAAEMFEKTNCDLVMVGRAALGRPWVFSQISAYINHGIVMPEPSMAQRMSVMIGHIKKLCEYKGDYIGMREARKHAAWY
ncbi:MAG: tRNA dihydrouridine synthase DusB, partial [Oscillospiraceae bacterium]|nr:tRNA dihydrouridine synthase DusB [Oscillospiraceae bacterium]